MNASDKQAFSDAMRANGIVYGREITSEQIAIYYAVLVDFSMADIRRAFFQHLKASRFFPTPAELIDRIPNATSARHIGADEAWSIVVRSMDERTTVVLTREIAEARATAWAVWSSGDEIGARMAFRDCYTRLTQSAEPPRWYVSLGTDAAERADAIEQAERLGRMPAGSHHAHRIEHAGATVSGLLLEAVSRSEQSADEAEKVKAGITRLREALSGGAAARNEQVAVAFEQAKAEALAQLNARMAV